MARVNGCLHRMPAVRQAQGERKRGSRRGGPIDPSTSSGRTERGFAPWRAHRPFDRLRANGKEVRAVEGPSTLRQAQGERKRGFAPWRAHRPFDKLRANRKRVRVVESPSTLRQAQDERKEGSRQGGLFDPTTLRQAQDRQSQGERKRGSFRQPWEISDCIARVQLAFF